MIILADTSESSPLRFAAEQAVRPDYLPDCIERRNRESYPNDADMNDVRRIQTCSKVKMMRRFPSAISDVSPPVKVRKTGCKCEGP
jgi:hypothetical protein